MEIVASLPRDTTVITQSKLPTDPPPGKTYLYVLIDPRNGEVRYIGKANNPQKRLWTHQYGHLIKAKTRKNCWIKSLKGKGLSPVMELVGEVPESEWENYEKLAIALFRGLGAKLTNDTYGGDGGVVPKTVGQKRDPEVCRKISKANQGKTLPQSTRRKISEKLTGRKQSPETRKKLCGIRQKMWDERPVEVRQQIAAKISENSGKAVIQYRRTDGAMVATFRNARQAEKGTGVSFKHISSVCLGKRPLAGGFIWRFWDDSAPMFVEPRLSQQEQRRLDLRRRTNVRPDQTTRTVHPPYGRRRCLLR